MIKIYMYVFFSYQGNPGAPTQKQGHPVSFPLLAKSSSTPSADKKKKKKIQFQLYKRQNHNTISVQIMVRGGGQENVYPVDFCSYMYT